jgi:hypothetical protein
MKRTISFIFLLAVLSCASGYLLSKASWIGRVGMTFFYKEYNFMKIWWQGAIAVFLTLMILFSLHSIVHRRLSLTAARLLHIFILLLVATGIYFTYDDFTNNLSHKILGHRFHYGFYLFWTSWLLICFFFIFKKRKTVIITTSSDKKETITQ